MILSKNDIDFLITELNNTPIMSEDDLSYIKSAHRQLYNATKNLRTDEVSLFTNKCLVYKLENKKLNEYICKLFNEPIENLYTMHRLLYTEGDFAKRHKDRFTTHKTVSIVLSENFTGGDMYINDNIVPLNKKGEYICFNGGEDFHEVKKVISGNREVLIIWFSKKQSKFSLI